MLALYALRLHGCETWMAWYESYVRAKTEWQANKQHVDSRSDELNDFDWDYNVSRAHEAPPLPGNQGALARWCLLNFHSLV